MKIDSRTIKFTNIFMWVVSFVFVGLFYSRVDLFQPLNDGFHEGEYLSSHTYFSGPWPSPVMIHGMMDVIPYGAGTFLLGTDKALAGTRLVNELLGAVSGILFLCILAALFRNRMKSIFILPIGLMTLAVANSGDASIVSMQQGAPAVRDVFILLTLLLMVQAVRQRKSAYDVLTGLAGLTCGLALFWAYNKGIAALIAISSFAFLVLIMERSFRNVAALILGFSCGVIINLLMAPNVFLTHVQNIIYWQENQYIWHSVVLSGRSLSLGLLTVGAILLAVRVGLYRVFLAIRRREADHDAAMLLSIAAVTGMAFLSSINRFDVPHAGMAIPYAVLAAAAAFQARADTHLPDWLLAANWAPGALLAPMALSISLVLIQGWSARNALRANIAGLVHGAPDDRHLAGQYLRVSDAIAARGGRCTYIFDNQAVFYHLSNLPPCSRFLVPVYVGRAAEASLLADLQKNEPEVILVRSTFWSYAIDDIPQSQRTPGAHQWALDHYSPAETIDGYELMVRNKK